METDAQAPVAEAVERCVELLCRQGCSRVNEYIGALQSGQPVVGIETLDELGRDVLLEELVSIMAVYQRSCADG